jgi:hypothetical protein
MQEIGMKPLIQTTRQTHSFFSHAQFVHSGIYPDKGRKYHKYTLKPSSSNHNNPTPTHKNNISVLPLTIFSTPPNLKTTRTPHEKHKFHSKTTITRSKNTPNPTPQEVKSDLKYLFASGTPLIFHTPSRGEGWKKNPQRVYLPLSPLIPVK